MTGTLKLGKPMARRFKVGKPVIRRLKVGKHVTRSLGWGIPEGETHPKTKKDHGTKDPQHSILPLEVMDTDNCENQCF